MQHFLFLISLAGGEHLFRVCCVSELTVWYRHITLSLANEQTDGFVQNDQSVQLDSVIARIGLKYSSSLTSSHWLHIAVENVCLWGLFPELMVVLFWAVFLQASHYNTAQGLQWFSGGVVYMCHRTIPSLVFWKAERKSTQTVWTCFPYPICLFCIVKYPSLVGTVME